MVFGIIFRKLQLQLHKEMVFELPSRVSEGHPAGVPTKSPFSVSFFSMVKNNMQSLGEVGTPASGPPAVPPSVPRTPGRCPEDFS